MHNNASNFREDMSLISFGQISTNRLIEKITIM